MPSGASTVMGEINDATEPDNDSILSASKVSKVDNDSVLSLSKVSELDNDIKQFCQHPK